MTTTTTEPMTDSTAFYVTDAGMDYLRSTAILPDADDLDAPLTADSDEGEGESDTFTPDTTEKADWVLGKIADHRAAALRIRDNADKMAREQEQQAAFLEWKFGAALQAFTRAQTEGTRKKSLRLFHGVLGYRTKPAGVTVTDDAAALSWARENLPAVVVERLDKAALGKSLMESGEALPFATFTLPEEVFYIKQS